MHIFVTTGKVTQVLKTKGVAGCVQEFGSRGRRALLKIVFSKKRDVPLRRAAIEALAQLGPVPDVQPKLDPCGQRWIKFDADLKAFHARLATLPAELRQFLFETSLAPTACRDTKDFLLALFSLEKCAYRREISECIRTYSPARPSEQPSLPTQASQSIASRGEADFLSVARAGIRNKNAYDDFRVGCLDALLILRPPEMIATLIAALGNRILERADYLVDRIVDALNELQAEGRDLEEVLLARLQEARVGDARDCLVDSLNRLMYRERGWELDPTGRILKALGRMGGKTALTSLVRMFKALPGGPTNTAAIQGLDLGTQEAILKSANQDSILLTVHMFSAIMEIHNRLAKTSELTSAGEIEELEHFLRMHEHPSE